MTYRVDVCDTLNSLGFLHILAGNSREYLFVQMLVTQKDLRVDTGAGRHGDPRGVGDIFPVNFYILLMCFHWFLKIEHCPFSTPHFQENHIINSTLFFHC